MRRDDELATDPTMMQSQPNSSAPTETGNQPITTTPPPLPDRYVLGRQLGAGGMGEVVLATDCQIGREVAIKRMRIAPTAEALSRFVREAKVQGRLDHPAIVPVHELSNDAHGNPFFVMKRLTGTTLAESRERFTRQRLLRAFADVCLAVEFAHSRGIIHRDLKPANIMLGDFGEVYVLDWGIARVLDETEQQARLDSDPDLRSGGATALGSVIGTPGYIAPEIVTGKPAEYRSDVYALGCVLFELLAGAPLVPRDRNVFERGPIDARPSRIVADVPPELDAICVAATADDSRPTARELAERIERFLDGDRDHALRTSIAAAHVEAAFAALEKGDGETERGIAMREAGRAIALDPACSDAAELVGRLMLEAPAVAPREVEQRLADIDNAVARRKAKLLAIVVLSFYVFVPTIFVMGLRSWGALGLFVGSVSITSGATTWMALRRTQLTLRATYVVAIVNALNVALLSHMFSPFLIAPGIASISVMAFTADHRIRWRLIVAITIAAVLLPWLLELAGVLPRTTTEVAGSFMLSSPVVRATFPQGELAMALYTFTMVTLAGVISSSLGVASHEALRTSELQAWHLRQLMRR